MSTPEAQFLVPDWGMKPSMTSGCCAGRPYVAWRADTTTRRHSRLPPHSQGLQSRLDTFNIGNHMPESTLTLCQSRLYPPVRVFGFGLCTHWLDPETSSPRIWAHVRGRYWSAKIDDDPLIPDVCIPSCHPKKRLSTSKYSKKNVVNS